MNKTTILGIVAAAIIGIGITAAYAGPNPMINLKGDVTVDGTLSNAAISTEITNVVTELQALTGAVQGIPAVQGPPGSTGMTGMTGMTGADGSIVQPTVRRVDVSSAVTTSVSGTTIISDTFTLNQDATVIVSSDINGRETTASPGVMHVGVFIDGVESHTLIGNLLGTPSPGWQPITLNWAGSLSAGQHTIDIRTASSTTTGQQFCGAGNICTMFVTIFE